MSDPLTAKRRAATLRRTADSTSQVYLAAEGHGIRVLGARACKGVVEVLLPPYKWVEVKDTDKFYDGRSGRSI